MWPATDREPVVDTCPLTKFESGLNLLHEADDDAVILLDCWNLYSECSTREIIMGLFTAVSEGVDRDGEWGGRRTSLSKGSWRVSEVPASVSTVMELKPQTFFSWNFKAKTHARHSFW